MAELVVDALHVRVLPDAVALGAAAAEHAAGVLSAAIAQRGVAHAMFATGNSQLTFLDALVGEAGVDWTRVVGFRGSLRFDAAKPDGTPRKLMDSARINALGWKPRTGITAGIALAYQDFLSRNPA